MAPTKTSPAAQLKAHDARARRAQTNITRLQQALRHNILVRNIEKRRAAKIAAQLKAKQPVGDERTTAVHWALSRVGTVEHPAGSNKGPKITDWQEICGYPGGGEPWCQCFATTSLWVASKHQIDAPDIGGYTVSVVDRAKTKQVIGGRSGWATSSVDTAKQGDWVYFDFDGTGIEHVGILLSHTGSTVTCVEGNTSASNGSQSNGGGVFVKTRSRSVVAAVVHVPYK